jgi:hypothetical protein
MKCKFLLLATLIILVTGVDTGRAGPLIIATNVKAACQTHPNGAVTNVLVTLNSVTYSFYGASLVYNFTSVGGSSLTVSPPSNNLNPVALFVPPGSYILHITTGSGLPSSPNYTINVPDFHISILGSRKFCPPRPASGAVGRPVLTPHPVPDPHSGPQPVVGRPR